MFGSAAAFPALNSVTCNGLRFDVLSFVRDSDGVEFTLVGRVDGVAFQFRGWGTESSFKVGVRGFGETCRHGAECLVNPAECRWLVERPLGGSNDFGLGLDGSGWLDSTLSKLAEFITLRVYDGVGGPPNVPPFLGGYEQLLYTNVLAVGLGDLLDSVFILDDGVTVCNSIPLVFGGCGLRAVVKWEDRWLECDVRDAGLVCLSQTAGRGTWGLAFRVGDDGLVCCADSVEGAVPLSSLDPVVVRLLWLDTVVEGVCLDSHLAVG